MSRIILNVLCLPLLPFAFVLEKRWADKVVGAYVLLLTMLLAAVLILNLKAWGLMEVDFSLDTGELALLPFEIRLPV